MHKHDLNIWVFNLFSKLIFFRQKSVEEFTSRQTAAICPSSIHVSVTTSVKEPPSKYSITTCINIRKEEMLKSIKKNFKELVVKTNCAPLLKLQTLFSKPKLQSALAFYFRI